MNTLTAAPAGPIFVNVAPPPKIQAAFQVIGMTSQMTAPMHLPTGGMSDGRELTTIEKRGLDAAWSTLIEYFNEDGFGEIQFNQQPPAAGEAGAGIPVPK